MLIKSIEGNWWGWTDGPAAKSAAVFPEDPNSVPITHVRQLTTACNSNSRESRAF